ncbi:MAG: hypothetical protein AAFQ21_05055 [Pseudomonadota bacterium]
MFLKIAANPHDAGRLTRIVEFERVPGQRFAIDADLLHREPRRLNAFRAHLGLIIQALDYAAYILLVAGVIGSFFISPWMFIPGVIACALMLSINRKSAGEIARREARGSDENFLKLHEMGAIWLMPG